MVSRCFTAGSVAIFLTLLVFISRSTPPFASAQDEGSNKISGLLALQIQAKIQSSVNPPVSGPNSIPSAFQPQGYGSIPANEQRIFLYSSSRLSQSQIQELQAMGLTVYADSWIPPVGDHPAGFVLADMPVDKLSELADKGYVARLDTAEQLMTPQNDLSNQKMNADDVWALSYNGTGVRVAVIDSGLDVTHPDIPAPVAVKDYYNYPDSLDDTIANIPGYVWSTGHGTHVTDSVLGRAANTGGSTYNGTAPGASLIFLKIGGDTTSSANASAMIGAMIAAVDGYSADVITMSYGSWDTYHDGSSAISQAVDYTVSQGAVVFVSAGNDAAHKWHYSGTVGASTSTDYISVNVTSAGSTTSLVNNLVWFDGIGTNNDLALEYYDSNHTLVASTDYTQTESDRGTESEYSRYNNFVPNGNSDWYLKVHNYSTNSQFFHIYIVPSGTGAVTFQSADPNYTISSPADADSAIAVGAYTTRTTWYDYNNGGPWPPEIFRETLNQISSFSSRGPRVDTGAPDKVNIVAPGASIISARDNDVYTWANRGVYYIDNNGPNRSNADGGSNGGAAAGPTAAIYYEMDGTSMAAPHAAGVAALILNAHPTWTPAQVKHSIEAYASDQGAGGFDAIYGWGIVDALAASGSSLAPTASYSDAAHTIACDDFDSLSSEHTVYMRATGLHPNYSYRVAYYDGDNTHRIDDDVISDSSGNISSLHTFVKGTDIAGTWHVTVSEPYFTAPSSYNGTWGYIISQDSFTVQDAAIPEFPTITAILVIPGLCGLIYLWLRRRTTKILSINA
jgi:subtilisin family serine protease